MILVFCSVRMVLEVQVLIFFLLVLAFNASNLIDKFEYKAVHLIKENGRCFLI